MDRETWLATVHGVAKSQTRLSDFISFNFIVQNLLNLIRSHSSSIFSCPFFLSSSSGTPMIRMLGHLTLSQSSLRLPSFLFVLFSSLLHLFPPFYLPTHLSSPLLKLFSCWFPSECFWSQLLHYSLLIDSSLFLLGSFKVFLASSQSLSLIYLSVTSFWFQDFGSFSLPLFRILYR